MHLSNKYNCCWWSAEGILTCLTRCLAKSTNIHILIIITFHCSKSLDTTLVIGWNHFKWLYQIAVDNKWKVQTISCLQPRSVLVMLILQSIIYCNLYVKSAFYTLVRSPQSLFRSTRFNLTAWRSELVMRVFEFSVSDLNSVRALMGHRRGGFNSKF